MAARGLDTRVIEDLPILFVDDESDILKALLRTVERSKWPVVTAVGAIEGLQRIEEQEFAVVVSDFRMPKMDGVEFLAQVRNKWPEAERILLTAYADTEALERGINDASISRFLRKPWKREVLLGILEQALRQSRLRREHALLVEKLHNRNSELSYVNQLLTAQVQQSDQAMLGFRRRWDVALNAISDPILIVNDELHIEGSNAAAATLSQRAPEVLEGQSCFTMLFGRQKACEGCPIPTGSGKVKHTVGKSEHLYDARAYRLPGTTPSHLCIYRDITRDVAFQNQAANLEMLAAIGRMAGGVAHEINNPLHGILSFVQLAQKPEVPAEKLARYHENIRDCALRCRDIVQALRNYSRQAKPDERTSTDLSIVLTKSLVLYEALEGKRIERKSPERQGPCTGNANQLQQVVVNLVQNAIDASPAGGEIQVGVEVDGDEVLVFVEDQGPGVPTDERDKIFEPFYTTKPEGVGTGLGLAISHTIMRDHGGSLRVGTAALGGARFEARLPLLRDKARSTSDADKR